MMLADAVDNCKVGPLRNFALSERDRHELKIAGLLHDCGKVTTPVHVVDKATKLQTLYDRIHLVDTRFEIIRRDVRLELQEATAEGAAGRRRGGPVGRRARWRRRAWPGSTRTAPFFARATSGRNPCGRRTCSGSGTFPPGTAGATPTARKADFLTADELENLTIPAGTLTREERRIINHHIDVTIRMLEALPWPRHLQNVPEYAGGHHERMDGKGYPRGLTRAQMSVQARCMGIADIFEALTAADRPYKKGKTLSESLQILGRFKQDGHIDPDLFDVFMWEKVYLRYAAKCMDPDQIDAVDVSTDPGLRRSAGAVGRAEQRGSAARSRRARRATRHASSGIIARAFALPPAGDPARGDQLSGKGLR